MKTINATYLLHSTDPERAVKALCRGQSVGNPDILTKYETREFLWKWEATGRVEKAATEGVYLAHVKFPVQNFGSEGVSYLLSVLMGGQCDIDLIESCRLMDLDLGHYTRYFPRPRYGIKGIRDLLGVYDRPLVCGILKPKIGLTPDQVAEVVEQMADGGCDVIKEDEILANQHWCPQDERLKYVRVALWDRKILYLSCITSDGSEAWRRARGVAAFGKQFAVHCNLWAGLGTLKDIRTHVRCPLFFQKSGDKVWTTGPYSIDPTVLCQLVNLIGCDFAHVGMYGGYMAESVGVLKARIEALHTTLPSFSCGMNPKLAEQIAITFGNDVMVTSGGWIHSSEREGGIVEAVKEMRRAVDVASTPSVV